MPTTPPQRERITIAILALGGQGGGVLADWIVEIAQRNGFVAQGTSVPGVAQRTGSTVYYVELFPASPVGQREPVMALMPAPGDIDIVIASELMEAGRAILRGFATERTLLIGSTHRIYAISEKAALSDGRASNERILAAAQSRTGRFIGFDMDEIAARAGSVISAVMFGALAGSGALPFPREAFEQAIKSGDKGIEASLAAFAAGFAGAATAHVEAPADDERADAVPTTAAGKARSERISRELPACARALAREGVRRLMDYQDQAYADLYLDRLAAIAKLELVSGEAKLTATVAKHLALWMSYEDTIRVADLKIRKTRLERVRQDVHAPAGSLIDVTDYMHPRLQEVCETLPAGLGRRLLVSSRARGLFEKAFAKGRHVRSTSLRWFLVLAALASLRRIRRRTLRYAIEQRRIEEWLETVRQAAETRRYEAALELVQCQRLIKGYGETHERGLRSYNRIMAQWSTLQDRTDSAAVLRRLREAAVADDEGVALSEAIALMAA